MTAAASIQHQAAFAICLCGRQIEAARDRRFMVPVYSCRCSCGMEGPTAETPTRAAQLFKAHWTRAVQAQHQAGIRATLDGMARKAMNQEE